jgi:hypothetical protein
MTTSLRYAAVTVLLVLGGFLFGATRGEAYVTGIAVGLTLVWLYGLALRGEVGG